MPSLKMSILLRIGQRSTGVQNYEILDKTLLSISSPAYKASIKFTEIIQNVLEILVVFNT